MKPVYGVDVSVWEPRVDWRILRSNGYRFAFVRATSGRFYVDRLFKSHWEGARREGLLRGAYHYLLVEEDALAQADHFIATVGSDRGELPPVVDLEDKYNENATNKQIIDTCKAVLDRIEKAFGRAPMIYSRTQYLKDHVSQNGGAPSWAKKYPLWLAQYPWVYDSRKMPNVNMPTQAVGWADWTFWQYSEKGIIPGVTDEAGLPTPCDLNLFKSTENKLYELASIPKEKPVEYLVKPGDTLKTIADQHGVTLEELLDANPNLSKPGSKLTIPVPTILDPVDDDDDQPGDGGDDAAVTPRRIHEVVKDDTLGGIAHKYGVTIEAIMAINPQIIDRNRINLGWKIAIP